MHPKKILAAVMRMITGLRHFFASGKVCREGAGEDEYAIMLTLMSGSAQMAHNPRLIRNMR
jgi:hypothetical protein